MEHNQRPESKDRSLSKENIPPADGFGSGNMERRRKSNVSSTSSQSFERDQLKGKTRKKDGRSSLLSKPRTPLKQQENIPSADGFGSGNKKPKLQTPFKQQENIPSADSPWSTASNTSFKGDCSRDIIIGFNDEQSSPIPELQRPDSSDVKMLERDNMSRYSTPILEQQRPDYPYFRTFEENIQSPGIDTPHPEPQRPDVRVSEGYNMSRYSTPMKKKTRGSRKTLLFP